MSIIVVEGVDASGKSTLLESSREIKGRYFTILRHSCRPLTPSDIGAVLNLIEHSKDKLDIILDRHPLISEPIYGPILRKNNLASVWGGGREMEILKKTVRKIIYCRPPVEIIIKNLSKNQQLDGVRERIHDLIDGYDFWMREYAKHGILVQEYDWTYHHGSLLEDLFFGDDPEVFR